jgi:UV DNA damage endonuclease
MDQKAKNPIHFGYACVALGIPYCGMKSCNRRNATEEKLKDLISQNLQTLDRMIDYNISRGIRLFRISSDLIPFGSNPVNQIVWWDVYADELERIGEKIKNHRIRVSMHPGQYTVLNSPDEKVYENSVDDLLYHARVLDAMKLDDTHRIIIHIGGIYNDKNRSIDRFIEKANQLKDCVKKRLAIENDEKSYNVKDLLEITEKLKFPAIFDVLHHQINPGTETFTIREWIIQCSKTWKYNDGVQKIHYSQQNIGKQSGSHSCTIDLDLFIEFHRLISGLSLDIMLEVKDKDLSAIKCLYATDPLRFMSNLEEEWSRYKYWVLERSPSAYQQIRSLLQNKKEYPVLEFYRIIDALGDTQPDSGRSGNAALHVWGYFKESATLQEQSVFQFKMEQFMKGRTGDTPVKSLLYELSVKYQRSYLLKSYYFSDLR